jgi:hypothetical protein
MNAVLKVKNVGEALRVLRSNAIRAKGSYGQGNAGTVTVSDQDSRLANDVLRGMGLSAAQ